MEITLAPLPNISRDVVSFPYGSININIRAAIAYFNINSNDDPLTQLQNLLTVIDYRKRIISGERKVPGTNYSGYYITQEYNILLKVVSSNIHILEQAIISIEAAAAEELRLRQLRDVQRLLEEQRLNAEYERRMFDIESAQLRSVMRQLNLEREEELQYIHLRNQQLNSVRRQTSAPSYIEVDVYVDSDAISNPSIILTDRPIDLRLRESFRIPTRSLTPIFSMIPNVRDTPIPLDSDVKRLLGNILGVDTWYLNNAWFVIDVPRGVVFGSGERCVSGLSAYTDEELLNYQVFGSCKFPYAHFINPTPVYHDNCIVNILIHKYHVQPNVKDALAMSTIVKWFNNGTSIRNILGFFKKFKIPYHVFDIAGKRLLTTRPDMEINRNRSAIAIMLFNNHACMYDIPLNETLDLSPSNDHTVKDWYSTHKNEVKPAPPAILVPGLKLDLPPNYTHVSERDCSVRSLNYEDPAERGRVIGYDMNKAFYNNFMKCNPNMKIGINSVLDEIVRYDGEEIISYAKYYLHEGVEVLGQQNNIMLGFRLAFLIDKGTLTKENIHSVKIPTYTDRCATLQNILKDTKNEFSIYNGILGKITTKATFTSMTMCLEDLQFLWHHHPELTFRDAGNKEYHVDIPMRKAKHRELNNRNYYEFIVEMTNHKMEVAMAKVLDTNPHVRVTKLWVDLVAFNESIDDRALGEIGELGEFKYEETFNRSRFTSFTYYDPVVISESIKEEIISFKDNCKVLTGMPGCGKTTKIKNEGGYDYATGFSNVASLLVSGKTLHMTFFLQDISQFYKLCSKFRGKTIWIDEISQMPAWIWSCIFTLFKRSGTKFILSGDRDQLRPYRENPNYDSMFFTELFRDATVLVENHRCTPALVDLAQRILHDNTFNFTSYKSAFDSRINYHFTLTKMCRDAINSEILRDRGLLFNPPTVGLRVVVKHAIKKLGLVKGSIYEVIHDGDKVKLQGIFPHTHVIDVKKSQYLNCFNVGYARTIDSCIGLTIEEPIAVYEIDKIKHFPYWQNRIYTAVTRVRKVEHLNIFKLYPPGLIVNRSVKLREVEDVELPVYEMLTPTCLPDNTLLTVY